MGAPSLAVDRYVPSDHAAFHELLRDPGVWAEYGRLVESGELEDPLAHPVLHPGCVWLARHGERVVGFGMLLVLPSVRGPWAHIRLGVRSADRRRGAGAALLRAIEDALAAIPPVPPSPVIAGAWLPAEDATAFLTRRAFTHFRYWWNMERPPAPVAPPVWPPGVELRAFDGSEHDFEEWTSCYNEAFSARFPSHLATVAEARRIAAAPHFRADGLLMAWRGRRCVGFCRDSLLPEYGEVDVLGVRPEAQGAGLGRALLRWGVDWLQTENARHVRLVVDGENEAATALYRSEGFAVLATRETWIRGAAPGAA